MAAEWTVRISTAADRELRLLPKHIQQEALDLIEDLARDPVPAGLAEPLRRNNRMYRQYLGRKKYRLIYHVDYGQRLIEVFRIRHRSIAYRGLRNP